MESPPLCLCSCPPLGAPPSRICCKGPHGSEGFWRPWSPTPTEAERQRGPNLSALCSPQHETTEEPAKLTQYTHPVRLFWPKSRCFDYLYQEAEALLRNFPVQATISFYEESESEESDDLEQDSRVELDD
ncbi:hypothetical protein lerEdw1_001269 [Lerista edwardsae]|nr:hypothetical protein lerEdw1_001269 [Lerista edwardsae]